MPTCVSCVAKHPVGSKIGIYVVRHDASKVLRNHGAGSQSKFRLQFSILLITPYVSMARVWGDAGGIHGFFRNSDIAKGRPGAICVSLSIIRG